MNYFPKFSKKSQEIMRVEHQKGAIKNSVNWFSHLMIKELMKHLARPGWKRETVGYLLDRLGEEVTELSDAIESNQPKEEVEKEAADVGNIAMMIADIYRQKSRIKSNRMDHMEVGAAIGKPIKEPKKEKANGG